MKQWEIYDYPFAEEGEHPVVIVSANSRAENPAFITLNGFFCRSVRPNFTPKPADFLLDEADGLDRLTAVRCDVLRTLERALIGRRRGVVSIPRRVPLFRKVLECFACPPR